MAVPTIYLSKDGKAFGPYTQEQINGMRASGEILGYAWICNDPAQGWVPVNAPPPPPPPVPPSSGDETAMMGESEPMTPAATPGADFGMIEQPKFETESEPAPEPEPAFEPNSAYAPPEPESEPEPEPMAEADHDIDHEEPTQFQESAPAMPTSAPAFLSDRPPAQGPGPQVSPGAARRVSASPSENSVIHGQPLLVICHNAQHFVSGTLIQITQRGGVLANPSPAELHPMFRGGAVVRLNLLDEGSGRSENLFARIEGAVKKEGAWEYNLSWENVPQILRT